MNSGLIHDYVRRANFTTKPRLQGEFSAFALFVRLLPREFFYAKRGNFTISKRGLVEKFAHFSDVNTHKGSNLVIGSW